MNLKEEILEYLYKNNMKIYQLAENADIVPSSLYRYLNGQRDLFLDTAEKIRKEIGKS